MTDYSAWYDLALIPNRPAIEHASDKVLNWVSTFCVILYWVAIFDKLRTTSAPDARRRLRVLCAGSVVGLGSILVIWGALPFFGIVDPSGIQWLGYLSAILMLAFPPSLAYVVVVQRAMDVHILLRMGTKYAPARGTMWTLRAVLIAVIAIMFWQTARAPQLDPAAVVRLALLCVPLFLISPRVFGPISNWIDRRFFREAYDVELFLRELSEQVQQFTETGPLIETVSRRISEVLHVPEIAVLLRNGEVFELRYAVGLRATMPLLLSEKSSPVEHVRETNRPAVLYHEDPGEWFVEANDQEKRTLREMQAELLLALPGRQHLMGIMALGRKKYQE
jgi:phosphoserine phosphatase RsbU/P